MRFILLTISVVFVLSCSHKEKNATITTGKLLLEMTDLERLTEYQPLKYRTIQFSSYDRRSVRLSDSCWFSNEDGFGNEPLPGFAEILKEPESTGIGEYLICDIISPGALVRLWTANINGRIRLYLDNTDTPFYEGDAQDFFWKTAEVLSGTVPEFDYNGQLRQFDATYFPVTFARRCRIEWIGDISKVHFYHVGVRVYAPGVKVETFKKEDLKKYQPELNEIIRVFSDTDAVAGKSDPSVQSVEQTIYAGDKKVLFSNDGSGAIRYFSVKLKAAEAEQALRQNILTIWFDNSSIPQVEAPVGDFFGAAPGLNPYNSLPFSIGKDSTMVCRFVMPFSKKARIEIENRSASEVTIQSSVRTGDYEWIEGKSMHFRARWKIDHGLTASYFDQGSYNVSDMLYLMASGKGRIVGTAAFIYNPSNATTSWGNWWGEGDEKIFVDQDTFPSFFGTGSEDYFNYSWSSVKIFSHPYCGQPRNDGPGNRGYVSNYRWHINDDILFNDRIAFYMELGHHDVVRDFSYGRIVYFYADPEVIDDYSRITVSDIRDITYLKWEPVAYLGSAGYSYTQAEDIIRLGPNVRIESEKICAGGKMVAWSPEKGDGKLSFNLVNKSDTVTAGFGLTLCHDPSGALISVYVNGSQVKIDGRTEIDLYEPSRTILLNHFTEKTALKKGVNEVTIESKDNGRRGKVGIDFIWMKKE